MNASLPRVQVSTRCSDSTAETELNLEQLARALARLYQLLEEYAPSWYTQEDRAIAGAALQALQRHLSLPEVRLDCISLPRGKTGLRSVVPLERT